MLIAVIFRILAVQERTSKAIQISHSFTGSRKYPSSTFKNVNIQAQANYITFLYLILKTVLCLKFVSFVDLQMKNQLFS